MIIIPSDVAGFLDLDNVCVRTDTYASIASNKYPGGKGDSEETATHNDEHDCVMLVEGLWKAIEKIKINPIRRFTRPN